LHHSFRNIQGAAGVKIISPKISKFIALSLMSGAILSLGACASFKKVTGSEKITPDEFRVVTKAPLVIPPEFNLRPPRPGEARPLELRPDLQARSAVFGVQTGVGSSDGEKLLIEKMGAQNADPRIREVIDEESGSISHKDEGFANKILKFGKKDTQIANPVAAEAEAEALRQELKIINNATGGQEVTIQQNKPRGVKLPGL
jgi:Protein of unknown function (DUF3035)